MLSQASPKEHNIANFINSIQSYSEEAKSNEIKLFIRGDNSSGINSEDVVKMIKEIEIKDNLKKKSIIETFIASNKSLDNSPEDFANMIKGVGLQNQVKLAIDLYNAKFSSSIDYIKDFFDVIKILHSSEKMQYRFLSEFKPEPNPPKSNAQVIEEQKEHLLKPFISGLQDGELALNLIEFFSERMLKNEETLSLIKGRLREQYIFLNKSLNGKSLEECINIEGINDVKALFGDDLKVNGESITPISLASYCDLKNKIPYLAKILTPELKEELRKNFSTSPNKLLYKPEELELLNKLLSHDRDVFDAKSYFIRNEELFKYLLDKVGNIEAVDLSKEYNINFANFGTAKNIANDVEMTKEYKLREKREEEEKQKRINALFNDILKSPNILDLEIEKRNPFAKKVEGFFSELFEIALPDNSNTKLAIFFQGNKEKIAHCFCNENLKKENFESAIEALKKGCFANIDMKFKKMICGAMISVPGDQILFAIADTKILSVIPRIAGKDITQFGPPLNNSIINSYFLSHLALFKQITQEEMLTSNIAIEIIKKSGGEDEEINLHNIRSRLDKKIVSKELSLKEEGELMEREIKKIAGYFILKQFVGDVIMEKLESENPELKEIGNLIDNRPQASLRNPSASLADERSTKKGRLN